MPFFLAGYGLVCHRVIKTLCQIIGVKDLHAKVEGNTKNYLAIVRGFLRLLHEQSMRYFAVVNADRDQIVGQPFVDFDTFFPNSILRGIFIYHWLRRILFTCGRHTRSISSNGFLLQETYEEVANRLGLHVVEFDENHNMVPQVLASPSSGIAGGGSGHKTDPLLRTRPLPPAPKCSRTDTDLASLHAFWKDSKKPPILEITNPASPPRVYQKPDPEYDPLNNLVDAEDEEVEESVARLLERGERDLDTLVTLKGL
ncbi:unnamed protein product, partial [Dibothriocephalus latus]